MFECHFIMIICEDDIFMFEHIDLIMSTMYESSNNERFGNVFLIHICHTVIESMNYKNEFFRLILQMKPLLSYLWMNKLVIYQDIINLITMESKIITIQ